jgi:hypothetical protein
LSDDISIGFVQNSVPVILKWGTIFSSPLLSNKSCKINYRILKFGNVATINPYFRNCVLCSVFCVRYRVTVIYCGYELGLTWLLRLTRLASSTGTLKRFIIRPFVKKSLGKFSLERSTETFCLGFPSCRESKVREKETKFCNQFLFFTQQQF